MADYEQRATSVLHKINELAAISEDPTCITRTFGTIAFRQGSQLIQHWMEQIGLETRVDAIGNVRGRLLNTNLVGKTLSQKTLVIASHMDTVINAGKFDGPMGIFMGLDVIDQLIRSGRRVPFAIELIAFSDEEGVRFHTTYLGSKVVAGLFDDSLLTRKDDVGIPLRNVIEAIGGDLDRLKMESIPSSEWLGYVEIHIEQGPVLYERNVPVAVVSAIAGQKRVELTFTGIAGHAGTVPMLSRQDALCAAAEFILAVEHFGQANNYEVVATVGKLQVTNAASNVIPGKVSCSLDIRSQDEKVLTNAYQTLQEQGKEICRKRAVSFGWQLIQETAPVACNPMLKSTMAQAIHESGHEIIELVSGAGHDGVPISQVSPIAMLFVRCFKGISHNPLENVELADIAATLEVADRFLLNLIEHMEHGFL